MLAFLVLFVSTHLAQAFIMDDKPPAPTLIRKFSVPHPGFLSLYGYASGDGYDLLISSFSASLLQHDAVYIVKHVERYLQDNSTNITPEVLTQDLSWPNEPSPIFGIFKNRTIAVAGGFLVPTKEHGAITLIDIERGPPYTTYTLTDHSEKWFYHRVEWFDMDGDGDRDALTCRANKPFFGSVQGELLWFENTKNSFKQPTPWTSHVIADGPDVGFKSIPYVNSTDGEIQAIFVSQFFDPALKVFWVGPEGNWLETDKIGQRIIDDTIGPVFDVDYCDVNGDGSMDLLVTVNSATNGSVWAFEIPQEDFRTGTYKRHLLASGFQARGEGMGKGAPGSARLIYTMQQTGYKASILLSGDDAGQAFLLNPRSEDKDDWSYDMVPFLDVGTGTVGAIDYADVDQDDHKEIFVPAYSDNEVYIYRV